MKTVKQEAVKGLRNIEWKKGMLATWKGILLYTLDV
jgi:hypothetical protein